MTSEYRCPNCQALLYSRRSKFCGQCGFVLPSEMVLTDAQAEARQEERQWARDLADKFGTKGTRTSQDQHVPKLDPAAVTGEDVAALEKSVRRMSCASEFKYRKRHTWLYVVGCVVSLFTSVEVILFVMGGRLAINHGSPFVWLISGGVTVLTWFILWRRAVPTCPNCKQNTHDRQSWSD